MIAVGAQRHDGQAALVMLHRADARTGLTIGRVSTFSVLTPLRWILSRLTLTVLRSSCLALVDRDVVHPHGVLLRHRRDVGGPMGLR